MKTLPKNDGIVEQRRNKQTGTLVGLYRSAEAGFDDSDEGKWSTVCEDHGSICAHSSRVHARQWMASPADWCEECHEIHNAKAKKEQP